MDIFIEIITVFWQFFWGLLTAIGTAIWEMFPTILELKKIMSYFTPIGAIALYLGVPTALISLAVWLVKKVIALH